MRSSAPLTSLLFRVGIVVLVMASGCNRANPNFHPGVSLGNDGGLTGQAGLGGNAGATGTAGAVGGTAGATDGGSDATLGSCQTASDCLAARGTPPCTLQGSWECRVGQCAVVCPSCTDKDSDGYGTGPGCAGLDCNDNDPSIGKTATRSCYDGKGGTLNVGACKAGAQLCSDGVWATTCTGQILPSGEACNGVDDDCNGKVDDDGLGTISCGFGGCAQTAPACANGVPGVCKPGTPTALVDLCDGKDENCDGVVDDGCTAHNCIFVAPGGDDTLGNGTVFRPFRSIQAGIAAAAAPLSTTKSVCVAGGPSCTQNQGSTYDISADQPLTMVNGVSVYGNYETRGWTRCPFETEATPNLLDNLTVTIAPRGAAGVTFPATVTLPTTLDGFHIARNSGGNGGGAAAATPTAGITVTGAKQVTISNVAIDEEQSSATSYGVNLVMGGEALITRSAIFGGGASASAIGVHSSASKPTIRENCATIDPTTGHCTAACSSTSLGIHGRYGNGNGGGMGGPGTAIVEGFAVDLVDSPGAIVERNAICGTEGTSGAGVLVSGMSTGIIVRGNSITADGATTQALGVSLLACGDAAPWIVDNELIVGDPAGQSMRAAGINVVGACHPVIDGNTKIASGASGTPTSAFGVYCGPDGTAANVPSRCFVSGNKLVEGALTSRPAASYAVSCDVGSCARVSGNTLVGGSAATVIGISLRETGAYVDRNVITGGCGTKTTTAVLADDAFTRVENNVVRGATCGGNATTAEADGVRVHVALTGNEVEIDSNTIIAGGTGQCQSVAAGIGLGNGAGPTAPHGIFRNNIMWAGVGCTIAREDFIETEAGAAPRIFSHNDLDPTGMPSLIVLPQPPSPTMIGDINQLTGFSGNVGFDPMFVSMTDFHLMAGSLCINAGSAADPPRTDFDGKPRDALPDIGAFEH